MPIQETKSVPISVQEIVAARIDTLDSGLALVLKVLQAYTVTVKTASYIVKQLQLTTTTDSYK